MKLSSLLKYNSIVIQCHDNPDADAICSGYVLYRYFKSHDKKVRFKGYNAFLTGKDNPVAVTLSCGKQVYVFAQAHCGAMGTLNRNRPKDPSGAIGLELQKKDWSKMKAYFTPSCDHSAQEKEY